MLATLTPGVTQPQQGARAGNQLPDDTAPPRTTTCSMALITTATMSTF